MKGTAKELINDTAIILFICYVLTSFIMAGINPFAWPIVARTGLIIAWITASIINYKFNAERTS